MGIIKYDFRKGDTLSTLEVEIKDKQTKQTILLDGTHTAQLIWSIEGAASVSRAMTVLTGADDGKVSYQFLTGELIAGTMEAQIKITEISSGKIATTVDDITKKIGPIL